MKIGTAMTFPEMQQAREKAMKLSKDGCVRHVNAFVTMYGNEIHLNFHVSEWYVSGSTVASYTNGQPT